MNFLFGNAPSPQIDIGSIGWEDEDDYFFPGTAENDGLTLVRVQLFRGRDFTKPLNETRAQGFKLVCVLPDGVFRVPPKNARCYVAIPHGMENLPGAGIIMATVSAGTEINRNITEGDLILTAPGGGQASVIIKKSGEIVLFTTVDNTKAGKAVVLTLTPTKVAFSAPWGSWIHDASGYHVKTKAGPRFDMGGITFLGIPVPLSSYITFTADVVDVGAAIVKLGMGPTYGAVLQAPSAALTAPPLPANTGSVAGGGNQATSVWISVP